MRKFFAVLLFAYAAWQSLTAPVTMQHYRVGQGVAQLFWAFLAVVGGVYLWRRGKAK